MRLSRMPYVPYRAEDIVSMGVGAAVGMGGRELDVDNQKDIEYHEEQNTC
jgi:hypothetical protein